MIFFSLLWTVDIVLLAIIVLRCLRTYNVFGLADESAIGAELPRLALKPGIYGSGGFWGSFGWLKLLCFILVLIFFILKPHLFSAVVLSKFVFEIVLYIQLRYRAIGIIQMMIPLWVFLALVSAYLLKGIIEFHKKFWSLFSLNNEWLYLFNLDGSNKCFDRNELEGTWE